MLKILRLVRQHVWGIGLLVVLSIGSYIAVRVWKSHNPGAMSLLESQGMDMGVMKPPVGSVPVATEVVHTGQFSAKVTYTGSVAPFQEQIVHSRVEGYLKELSIYNGDRVSSGQLIAVVDSPDLQTKAAEASAGHAAAVGSVPIAQQNLAKAEGEHRIALSEVKSAQSELQRANSQLAASQKAVVQREKEQQSAQADLEFWSAEIARKEKLYSDGAISLQDLQSAKAKSISAKASYENKIANVDEAKANVDAARSNVSSRQAMLEAAEVRVSVASSALTGAGYDVKQKAAVANQAKAAAKTASVVSDYRNVRAPIAGVVSLRYQSPGQFVSSSTPIAGIVQIDRVRLQANVSDADIDKIKVGAQIEARFYKLPGYTVKAAVTSVSPLSDQISRTAMVEAIVDNPGHKLLPGDAVTMDIVASHQMDAISVPASAVITRNNEDMVWIVQTREDTGKPTYYCTMHPEVVSDEPGICPKCLMKLVPKTIGGNKTAHMVKVTTGPMSGDRVLIKSGLRDGDEVIYRGNTYLSEGDSIFPTKWGEEGPLVMPGAPDAAEIHDMDMHNMPGMNHGKKDSGKQPSAKVKKTAQLYRCPMHHEITSTDPNDLCKICGMKINEPVEVK